MSIIGENIVDKRPASRDIVSGGIIGGENSAEPTPAAGELITFEGQTISFDGEEILF